METQQVPEEEADKIEKAMQDMLNKGEKEGEIVPEPAEV